MRAFSHATRAEALRRIAAEPFDVLVIGCGIVGAGIARDAAVRGLRVAAVDAGDLGGGTSGRTSRLVHGGLRYLERFRLRLVAQAARERDLWIRLAPELVEPLEFVIPAGGPAGVSPWKLRIGLSLYDALSSRSVLPRRRWVARAASSEPLLRTGGAGAIYADARTDDARFVLEVARDAHEAGASIATYARVASLRMEGGRVVGAAVRDRWSPAPIEARARVVVNAAGPWLDRVRELGGQREPRLRPTKGVHLVVSRSRLAVHSALALRAADGRAFFVIPWDGLAIIGTTDTDHVGDVDRVAATARDVDYLLRATNAALRADLSPADVLATYASLRPLLASAAREASDISRRHAVWEESNGLVCVAGGKLTTHRAMAREVVDRILRRMGAANPGDLTRSRPLRPHPPPDLYSGLPLSSEQRGRLRRLYPDGGAVAALRGPSGMDPIAEGSPVLWGELDHALDRELVMTVSDFMVRRTGLLYAATDHGDAVAPRVGERIAARIGFSPEERARQIAEFRADVGAALAFRR